MSTAFNRPFCRILVSIFLSLGLCTLAEASTRIQSGHQVPGSLELRQGDRVCLLGNALAERMQHDGWLETRLQQRLVGQGVSFRNLGFGADELAVHQRTSNFGKFSSDSIDFDLPRERFVPWDRYLEHERADVIWAFFGYNESFQDEAGLNTFRENLLEFIRHVEGRKYNGESAPRLVLFGSIPQENWGDPNLPDGIEHNRRIQLYNECMAAVGKEEGIPFVDLFGPMAARYADTEQPLTIDGIHLRREGNRVLAGVIEKALFANSGEPERDDEQENLLALVREKNELWFQRYRVTDGYNVYGGRSRLTYKGVASGEEFSNFEILQRELDHLDDMVADRDQAIWSLAKGEESGIDDSHAVPLLPVETNKAGGGPQGQFEYLSGQAALADMTPAPGMEVNLFADEARFPELVNPVQMSWDTRGRLWVAVWPTYPHWTPGRPMNDKLLILEDADGDGRADTCTVFADNLLNPTGFEFWNGGVIVAQVPDIVFLEDTDGDGHADTTERLLHGLSSADTHHSANSFVLGPDGALYFQEGTFHQTQIETVYGPMRNHDACVWRYEPRTHRVERYIPYNFANPHGHVFDRWGQDFMTDGTGNVNYYALPFSGYVKHPAKHRGYFPFFQQRSRPAGGTEILSSLQFPGENQGNYLIANVIGFRGIFQYQIHGDGAGFSAEEVTPIVQSTDQNFRPVDLEVGPDGGLYFLDWHNAIIGHMQHHLRDPSRDVSHGRVYRVTYAGRPLSKAVDLTQVSVPELLTYLQAPEDRVRYRTRIELSGRDSEEVFAALPQWIEHLDSQDPNYEHNLLEGLWLTLQFNHTDQTLLRRVLEAQDPRARAAATRVLRYGRRQIPLALELLRHSAVDPDPRVRLEAVVAASFFDSSEAASIALEVLRFPMDRFLDYALGETMGTLEKRWKQALRAGESLAVGNEKGIEYLLDSVSPSELMQLPRIPAVLNAIIVRSGPDLAARREAARELAEQSESSLSQVVLGAVMEVDRSASAHGPHVLHELGQLLAAEGEAGLPPDLKRVDLMSLAENGRQSATRALGYRLLVQMDGSVEKAWNNAVQDPVRLQSFLECVAEIPDPNRRADLGDRIRDLMFAPPAGLRENYRGTGLDLSFYEPAPPDARASTFDELVPQANSHPKDFQLDPELIGKSDSFGLRFEGTLFAPKTGLYRFFTTSDDGSRLYIGERCVVDNDGPHGMVERSGEVQLSAGAHAISVTFFESGGAEGLRVDWQGPGFEREAIPAGVLGSGGGRSLRAAALQAMAHVPGRRLEKLDWAARLLGEGQLLQATMDLVASIDLDGAAPESVQPVIDALAAHVAELPPADHTLPSVVSALEIGRGLTVALDDADAARSMAMLDGLGGSVILIRTLPHQMRYDLTEFWVERGRPVSIVFQNNDMMPHNLVIAIPGSLATVGEAAEVLSAGSGAQATSYVPELDAVLWHTRLLLPGESERLAFVAPEVQADHPFLCTYPGHWRVMNGVMHVVEKVAPDQRLKRREVSDETISVRKFVRDWTLEDLLPKLTPGWEKDHSRERGRLVFDQAGCIKCHTIAGEGSIGGPELTKIREKFTGADLLRQIIEPSREIADEYKFWGFDFESGPSVIGRILEQDEEGLVILPNLLEPDIVIDIVREEVVEQWDTVLSPMPTGLLVTFQPDEILDLLLFLQSPKEN